MTNAFASGAALRPVSERLVIILSALLGTMIMLGLALTMPKKKGVAVNPDAEALAPRLINMVSLCSLSVIVMFVLAGFELGIVLEGKQHSNLSTHQVPMMFAECALVMLGINALLFFTSILNKLPARLIIVAGSLIGILGLSLLALRHAMAWMLIGVSLTSAGTGLVLPVISFLAASGARRTLGATMGGLAAASGLGQTMGSVAGGWLFAAQAQVAFGWLALPLLFILVLLIIRRTWLAV